MKKRIDVLLFERGLAPSREKARTLIMAGSVYVNNQKFDKPGDTVSDDAVLFILSAHGNDRYLPVFRKAKARNLTTILITCDPDSPLIPYSTISICTNDQNREYRHTDVNSRIGFFTVIQILIELAAQGRTGGTP